MKGIPDNVPPIPDPVRHAILEDFVDFLARATVRLNRADCSIEQERDFFLRLWLRLLNRMLDDLNDPSPSPSKESGYWEQPDVQAWLKRLEGTAKVLEAEEAGS